MLPATKPYKATGGSIMRHGTIIGAATCAVLLLPTAVFAKTTSFFGEGRDDAKVKVAFDVKMKDGDPVQLEDIEFRNLQFRERYCPKERFDIEPPGGNLPVNRDGEFSLTYSRSGGGEDKQGRLKGHFESKNKAIGFLKYTETLQGEVAYECNTGRTDWVAKKDKD
jgi:hypothetical protein